MALAKANIKIEHREILLKKRPSALYEISPKGTVPVLYINDENIIEESLDIIIWAIENSHCNWLAHDKEKQINIIQINDSDFKYWLDRYKYSDRFTELSPLDYQNNCKKYLEEYNGILKNKLYFFGNDIQMLDIALFPFIRQCAYVDVTWFEKYFSNLNNWLNNIQSSNLFLSVMKKYKMWDQNNSGIITNYK